MLSLNPANPVDRSTVSRENPPRDEGGTTTALSPPLPFHPPLHPPLQPPPRSPPCGLTRYDTTGAAWTYDFAPLAAAPLTADGERFSFRLALCGVAEAACRPAACVNASVCEPYDENLAQHGAAVAFVRGAVAPGPAGRGGCFEEGAQSAGVAAACTAPCSVLAPATLPAKKGGELQPHSSRWELSSTERQPHVSPLLRFSPQARRRLHTPPASRAHAASPARSRLPASTAQRAAAAHAA